MANLARDHSVVKEEALSRRRAFSALPTFISFIALCQEKAKRYDSIRVLFIYAFKHEEERKKKINKIEKKRLI